MNRKESNPKQPWLLEIQTSRVVSNGLNQTPALSFALILQFLILLPVLHSLFAASLMGVGLQGENHLLRESIFPGPLSCRSERQPRKEQLQLCRSFSEVQQKGVWQDVVSFIIFYFPSCGSVWTELSTITAVVPGSIREGEKTTPSRARWLNS